MTAQLVFELIDDNGEFILCIFVIPMTPYLQPGCASEAAGAL